MIDMPIRTIHALYISAFEQSQAEIEKKEQEEKEAAEAAKKGKPLPPRMPLPKGSMEDLVDMIEEGG